MNEGRLRAPGEPVTYVRTVAEEGATGEVREVYEQIRKDRGAVANIYRAESLNPAALRRHLDLYMELLYGKGGLSRREREMVAVAVSATNRCEYCLVHHADALGRYVKEPGLVPLVASDWTKAPLVPRERALVEAAVKLTKEPQAWDRQDVEKLHLAGFQDEDVLALVQITAYFNYVNRLATGLGVTADDAAKEYRY